MEQYNKALDAEEEEVAATEEAEEEVEGGDDVQFVEDFSDFGESDLEDCKAGVAAGGVLTGCVDDIPGAQDFMRGGDDEGSEEESGDEEPPSEDEAPKKKKAQVPKPALKSDKAGSKRAAPKATAKPAKGAASAAVVRCVVMTSTGGRRPRMEIEYETERAAAHQTH